MELKLIVEILTEFLSISSKIDANKLAEITLEHILKANVNNLQEKYSQYYEYIARKHNFNAENDELRRFCLICLNILFDINDCKYDINPENIYFSVNEELKVACLCEFTVCFGIHYNLEDNVGFPIEQLSKYGINIREKRCAIDPHTRNSRLHECLTIVNKIRLNRREHIDLMNIFYRKYLQDIITSLLQLSYSPNSTTKDLDLKRWLHVDLFNEVDFKSLVRVFIMTQGLKRLQAPKWLLENTGVLLTNALMRPNSVLIVIKAVLEEINGFTNDWKKCDAVAQILAQQPRNVSIQSYVHFIAPQLLNIFTIEDAKIRTQLVRVAGSIFSLFAHKYPDLTRISLVNPIIQPLLSFPVDSSTLMTTIKLIHLVFVSSTEPNWQTLKQLDTEIIHLIFQLYNFACDKITCKNITHLAQDVLKLYLNMKQDKVAEFLWNLLECGVLTSCVFCAKSKNIVLNDNLTPDSIYISSENSSTHELLISDVEKKCINLTNLVIHLKDNQISIDFIFLLFDKLTIKKEDRVPSGKSSHELIEIEQRVYKMSKCMNEKILSLTQLSNLFEKIDPHVIIDNHARIIEFCRLTLESILNTDEELYANEAREGQSEIAYLVITILTLITSESSQINYEMKKQLQIFLPLLNKLRDLYVESEMATLSDMLFMNIASFGVIQVDNPLDRKHVLIQEIDDDDDWKLIERELNDILLPTRGHGLILLKKYLENPKKLIEDERLDRIFEILSKNIQSDDSYIYLNAIKALVAYANRDSNRAINTLLVEFSNKKLDEETRVKIGEALVKSIKNLGDLVSKYGQLLLDVFLSGTKSDNELIRSSSLSNLGETCKMLNYSLSAHLVEIINCISCILETDKSKVVRRSSMLTLKLIFEGLNENFIHIVGSELKNLYRILKKVISQEQDDVIRLQAQLAYENLDDLMKEFLFPKQNLEKTIKI